MNKLLFKLERNLKEDSVIIKAREGYENDIASLEWVKHV